MPSRTRPPRPADDPTPPTMLSSPPVGEPLAGARRLLTRWPRHRYLAAAGLGAVWLWASRPGGDGTPGWSWPLSVTSAVVAGLVLASYVPPAGRRGLDIGCSPCAAVAGLTVVGSLVLRTSSPGDLGMALAAQAVLVFGLVQRLTDPSTCPTR